MPDIDRLGSGALRNVGTQTDRNAQAHAHRSAYYVSYMLIFGKFTTFADILSYNIGYTIFKDTRV